MDSVITSCNIYYVIESLPICMFRLPYSILYTLLCCEGSFIYSVLFNSVTFVREFCDNYNI